MRKGRKRILCGISILTVICTATAVVLYTGDTLYLQDSFVLAFGESESVLEGGNAENWTESKASDENAMSEPAESESESEPERESESVSEDELESAFEHEAVNGLESESAEASKRETEGESESESSRDSERISENESERGRKGESESELKSDAERASEKESECGMESKSQNESGNAVENKTENAMGNKTENGQESEGESDSETVQEAEPERELKYESECVSEKERQSEMTEETESPAQNSTEDETKIDTVGTTDLSQEGETEDLTDLSQERETEGLTDLPEERETENTTDLPEESETGNMADLPEERETENTTDLSEKSETENTADLPEESETGNMADLPEESETENTSSRTLTPEPIYRGKQYEIRGEQNAWYRDGNDRLWIRRGTGLSIETATGSGYGTGPSKQNLQEDGNLTFSLKKVDGQGNVLAESTVQQEAYYVDGEAPSAQITVTGTEVDGILYAAQVAESTIRIEPDGKSGLKTAAYAVVQCQANGSAVDEPQNAVWYSCDSGTQVSLSEEGMCILYVRTEDNVGNLAFSKSRVICIDQTPPEISIDGVEDQTANAGNVKLKIACSDAHYKSGSLQVQISGQNTGKMPTVSQKEETELGASAEYFDFPKQKAYDDVYRLTVQAEDLSGNVTEQVLEFSVNRFGSVYDLSAGTKSNLQKYYLSDANDVVFYETNIDYVGESQIFCRRDGELTTLVRGRDYTVSMQGSRNSWKRYQYTIPAEYFRKEGVYELLLTSKDSAENESDTGLQQKRVAFALDWTAPSCTVTGIEAQSVYEADTVTAVLVPQDNIGIRTMKIYHNSELLLEERPKSGEVRKVQLDTEEQWQTLQIFLEDYAGNRYWSEEIPVYVGAQSAEVSAYRKLRASARERAEKAEKEENEEADTSPAKTRQISSSSMLTLSEAAGAATEDGQAGKALQDGSNVKQGDYLLLILGLLAFSATAAALLLSGMRRRTRRER